MWVKLWERMLCGMPVNAFMDRRTVHKRPSRFEGSQLQGVGQSVGQKPPGNKKAAEISGLFVILGGGTGRPYRVSIALNQNKISLKIQILIT